MKPFEFEKVSAEEARWARDGEPANPDAAKWTDKRTRAPEEPLLNVTRTWLASLPQDWLHNLVLRCLTQGLCRVLCPKRHDAPSAH